MHNIIHEIALSSKITKRASVALFNLITGEIIKDKHKLVNISSENSDILSEQRFIKYVAISVYVILVVLIVAIICINYTYKPISESGVHHVTFGFIGCFAAMACVQVFANAYSEHFEAQNSSLNLETVTVHGLSNLCIKLHEDSNDSETTQLTGDVTWSNVEICITVRDTSPRTKSSSRPFHVKFVLDSISVPLVLAININVKDYSVTVGSEGDADKLKGVKRAVRVEQRFNHDNLDFGSKSITVSSHPDYTDPTTRAFDSDETFSKFFGSELLNQVLEVARRTIIEELDAKLTHAMRIGYV